MPRKGQTLNRKITQQILKASSQLPTIGERLKFISAQFIGKPYIIGPLIGSDTEPEVFTATYDGFDCVTYLETCLALAWAKQDDEVNDLLRAIRYRNGNVQWEDRLHYTTDWHKYHVKRGAFTDVTRGDDTLSRTKEINFLKCFAPRTITFRYFPKRKLNKVSKQFRDGDLIYFASTRKGLDTFHVGLLVWVNGKLMLRHSAKSKGGVVEQELAEFVKVNTMPGFIIARPKESIDGKKIFVHEVARREHEERQ
ncbi:MAG TPA: N-acetylmuramoyl-L-alanine amidase-like domain-containing protein [Blastocatellia bacterium]|nr:N-acetylmuramoyl-L-alanine amidase-like domain-containing protein [Blastocatellia bacterium]